MLQHFHYVFQRNREETKESAPGPKTVMLNAHIIGRDKFLSNGRS